MHRPAADGRLCNIVKKYLLICIFLAPINLCFSQLTTDQKFSKAIQDIVFGFSKQDDKLLSKYIKSGIGINLIYRDGVYDNYTNFKKIVFSDSSYPSILFATPKSIKILSLKYETLPKYDCFKEAWSKKGIFVDTTKVDHLLSRICKNRNKNVPDNIPSRTIAAFTKLENSSRRVISADKNGKELVFYVTLITNEWYLTIFDTATSDCGL